MKPTGSGGFVGAGLVASDLSRRRINDEVQRRCSGRLGLGHVRRQSQMPEDARNHRGVFDEGDQGEASATPRTGKHIQAQAPAHQLRPEIVACVATVRRAALSGVCACAPTASATRTAPAATSGFMRRSSR